MIIISEKIGSKYLLIVMDFPESPRKSQLKIYAECTQSRASSPVAIRRPSTPSLAITL